MWWWSRRSSSSLSLLLLVGRSAVVRRRVFTLSLTLARVSLFLTERERDSVLSVISILIHSFEGKKERRENESQPSIFLCFFFGERKDNI